MNSQLSKGIAISAWITVFGMTWLYILIPTFFSEISGFWWLFSLQLLIAIAASIISGSPR